MSFPTVRTGIHTNFRAYTGIRNIIGGMPSSIHFTPALITQFQRGERIGQTNVFYWYFLIHVVLENQVNDIAESEIDAYVPLVFEAVSPRLTDADGRYRSQLGGAANTCWFEEVKSGDTDGYITFGQGDAVKTYRRVGLALVAKTMEAF